MVLVINLLIQFYRREIFKEIENKSSVFLSSISINLLAFYHELRPLIGYATHVIFCDR